MSRVYNKCIILLTFFSPVNRKNSESTVSFRGMLIQSTRLKSYRGKLGAQDVDCCTATQFAVDALCRVYLACMLKYSVTQKAV